MSAEAAPEEATRAVIDAARTAIMESADGLDSLAHSLDDQLAHAASVLRHHRGKVILTGSGTNAFVAQRSAHLLSVCGTPAFFVDPTDALHGTLGALDSHDVLIAMSRGGATAEVVSFVRLAHRRGVPLIALSSREDAELFEYANVPVLVPVNDAADPGGFIAMGSTLAYSAWLDALTLVLMRAKQYPWEEVLFTHPGGSVGALKQTPPPLEPLAVPRPDQRCTILERSEGDIP